MKLLLKPILLLVLIGIGIALYTFTPFKAFLTSGTFFPLIEKLRQNWWFTSALMIAFAVCSAFAIPVSPISLTIGAVYGFFPGVFLNLLGCNLGASAGFLTSRYLGRGFVAHFLKGRLKVFDEKSASHGFRIIFLSRFLLFLPFAAINFGAGLSKIRYRDYALATLIAMIPGIAVHTYFAASLVLGVAGNEKARHNLIVSTILVLCLMLFPVVYQVLRKRRIIRKI